VDLLLFPIYTLIPYSHDRNVVITRIDSTSRIKSDANHSYLLPVYPCILKLSLFSDFFFVYQLRPHTIEISFKLVPVLPVTIDERTFFNTL
jgi:hypothetical protein